MALHIDGTDLNGSRGGDGRQGSWHIFDDELQTWVITNIRWRWWAHFLKWRLEHPVAFRWR